MHAENAAAAATAVPATAPTKTGCHAANAAGGWRLCALVGGQLALRPHRGALGLDLGLGFCVGGQFALQPHRGASGLGSRLGLGFCVGSLHSERVRLAHLSLIYINKQ